VFVRRRRSAGGASTVLLPPPPPRADTGVPLPPSSLVARAPQVLRALLAACTLLCSRCGVRNVNVPCRRTQAAC
jgi:hypothetical protein